MNYLSSEIVLGKYITNNYGKAVSIIQKKMFSTWLKIPGYIHPCLQEN